MMAKIQFSKGDKYLSKLSQLDSSLKDQVIGPAVYDGAAVVADAIRAGIQDIPTDERHGTPSKPVNGPSRKYIRSLSNDLGIAKIRNDDGYINVKIGWDGYSSVKTKKYPKGVPTQMLARSVERGTSFMRATPFVKKAVSASKKQAVEQMKQTIDENIDTTMKG